MAQTPQDESEDEAAESLGDAPTFTPFTAYGLPPEERAAAAEVFRAALTTAGPDFGAASTTLTRVVADAGLLPVMGVLALYVGSAEAGTNPEHNRPLGLFQHHLELAQAVLLRDGAQEGLLPPWRHVPGLADAIKAYNDAWILLQFQKVERASGEADRDLERLLVQLRLHASTNRGWGYQSRMDAMLSALLEPLSNLADRLGFAMADLPIWWQAQRALVNVRLQQHREAVQEALSWPVDATWFSRIAERFGKLPEPAPGFWTEAASTDDEVRTFYVIQTSDLRAHEIYRFTLDELIALWPGTVAADVVRVIVDSWAMEPGDDGGVALQRLPLENPVVRRPFIRSGEDTWHLFCGWLLWHNPFELIEAVLGEHPAALEAYKERRAAFLEERAAELLTMGLGTATIESSLLSVDPTDGKEYENDVVAFISSFAVVAEAKAGRLHPDARRGKSRVLRDRIDELVVRPSEQGQRLAARLEAASEPVVFKRKVDGTALTVDARKIRRTLTVAVTLEPIADLLPRLADIADAGMSKAAATALSYNINVLDLELVMDLLDHPSEVLHYLGRRAEIERRTFLGGDEVDLLALYLQTGFNVGEREFTGRGLLDVTGLSDPIDVWHYRREAGMEATKPRPTRTPWWEAVLTRVETRATDRWAEVGVAMCNVAPPEQQEFENAMHELRRSIGTGQRAADDFLVFQNGPPERRDVFVGVIAASADPAARRAQYQAAVAGAAADINASRIILLAWTPVPIEEPYFALAVYDAGDT